MNYIVNESELITIIRETICELVNTSKSTLEDCLKKVVGDKKSYLAEMAFKRKEYKGKIDNLSAQVIENLCLIRYGVISGNRENINHWQSELKGHLLTMARYNIKGTEQWIDKEQAIREVWNENDYFVPKTIEYVIYNKFRKEGFDTESNEFVQTINDCINSFNTLLHLIAVGYIMDLYNYVEHLTE